MPSIHTLAQLSQAVYDESPQAAGWSRAAFKPERSGVWEGDGFQGATFTRGDEVVFAFAGTDPSSHQDIRADLKLGLGMNTGQFRQAGEFLDKTLVKDGSNVSVTGHSLGGAIAQIIGNRRGLPFCTFNAPGVAVLASRNVDQMAVAAGLGTMAVRMAGMAVSALADPSQAMEDIGAAFRRARGVNFRLEKDVVGRIGVHYGDIVTLPFNSSATDVLTNHSMDSVLEALGGTVYETLLLRSLV